VNLAGLSRFSDPTLLILTSLAGGPKHGYAMIEDIQNLADVKLGPGTLYGALARLEQYGLIAPLPSIDRRQPYCLTAAGEQLLKEQLATIGKFASIGLQRLAAL
jgi:DNA-binding PadR family transcriptional regulator